MPEERWECREPHHEDITEQVAKAQQQSWVFRAGIGALLRRDHKRTVTVFCSAGHRNVIDLGT